MELSSEKRDTVSGSGTIALELGEVRRAGKRCEACGSARRDGRGLAADKRGKRLRRLSRFCLRGAGERAAQHCKKGSARALVMTKEELV